MKAPEHHMVFAYDVQRWKPRKPIWIVLLNHATKEYELKPAVYLTTIKQEWHRRQRGLYPEHDSAIVEVAPVKKDMTCGIIQVDFSRMFINELDGILECERWNKFVASYPALSGSGGNPIHNFKRSAAE